MLVYIAVGIVSVVLALYAEHGKSNTHKSLPRRFSFVALAVLVILAGVSAMRWRVGTDYRTYEELFFIYAKEVNEGIGPLDEPGLKIIAWLGMQINGDPALMFAVAAIITVGLTLITLWRWSPVFSLSTVLYIVTGAWHGSFNGIRQYLAGAILFAGHRYIIDRKPIRWTLVVVLASLFHTSACIGILFYFLPTRKTTFWIQFLILSFGIIAMFAMSEILALLENITSDSSRWGGTYAVEELNPLRVAFAVVPIALYWLLNLEGKIKQDKAWFYINMLCVYAAVYVASASSALMARYAIYVLPFLSIGLVYVTWVKNPKERLVIRSVIVILYTLFMYISINSVNNLRNFQWIFERQ